MTGSLVGSVLVFVGGAAVAVGVLLALLGARGGQAVGPPPRGGAPCGTCGPRPGPGPGPHGRRSDRGGG